MNPGHDGTVTTPTNMRPRVGGTGPLMFARFAYPPNAQGYCGPDMADALLRYAANGFVDSELVGIEREFQGAWPYLEMIAAANGLADPLDRRVVEAYWVGNHLLDAVDPQWLHRRLQNAFPNRATGGWPNGNGGKPAAVAHHNFHVCCVYPWSGLLDTNARPTALSVLDHCLIRPGRVRVVDGDEVVVRTRPLTFDDRGLRLGQPHDERVRRAKDRIGLVKDLRPGDWVALHWGWVCERLDERQFRGLADATIRALQLATECAARP
ncbi:MAG: DUF6390 family protein [Euzebya sp.]